MDILVTGAFGNVGRSTVDALLVEGHRVRCFDVKTPANLKAAKRLAACRRGQISPQAGLMVN